MAKTILLTFDIEEFDLPLEHGCEISKKEQLRISREGLGKIIDLLDKHKLKATFFVTAEFALNNKPLIKKLSMWHEIALHGLIHKDDYRKMKEEDALERLKKGKQIIEKIIGKKIYGFRAPRFHIKQIALLPSIGLMYDSSLHPTYIPRRYNNFFAERKIHRHGSLLEIPVSVTPLVRLPLFWFVFRNVGLAYSRFCTKFCFLDSGYVMLFFHPWEFMDISGLDIPYFIRNKTGKKLAEKVDTYIKWAKKRGYRFDTVKGFLEKNGFGNVSI